MLKTRHIIILFIPAILVVAFALFIRVVQFESLRPKIEQKKEQNLLTIPIFPDDPIVGNKKAPVAIIAFEDFGCEKCRQQDEMLAELIKKYPEKIKIIWKFLSVTRFPYTTEIANQYAYCANEQKKFNEFKQLAFTNSENLSQETLLTISQNIKLDEEKLTTCLNSEKTLVNIENNKQVALMLNIQAVPRFFIDNKQIQTPASFEEWEMALGLKSGD